MSPVSRHGQIYYHLEGFIPRVSRLTIVRAINSLQDLIHFAIYPTFGLRGFNNPETLSSDVALPAGFKRVFRTKADNVSDVSKGLNFRGPAASNLLSKGRDDENYYILQCNPHLDGGKQ